MSYVFIFFIGVIHHSLPPNLSISEFVSVPLPKAEPVYIPQPALAVDLLSDPPKSFILQPAPLVLLSVSVPRRLFLLSFNGQIFHTLSDVLKHIRDYPEGKNVSAYTRTL